MRIEPFPSRLLHFSPRISKLASLFNTNSVLRRVPRVPVPVVVDEGVVVESKALHKPVRGLLPKRVAVETAWLRSSVRIFPVQI